MGRTLDEDESRFIHGCSLGSWGRRGGEWGNHAQPAAAKLLILTSLVPEPQWASGKKLVPPTSPLVLLWLQAPLSPRSHQGSSSEDAQLQIPAHKAKALPPTLSLRRCREMRKEHGFESQLPRRPGDTTCAHFIVSLGLSFRLCRVRITYSYH